MSLSHKHRLALAFACVVALGAALIALRPPGVFFDPTKPAFDVNSEHSEGRQTAWGPRPARWLIWADPTRSTFSGQEWYFRLFRSYCREWVATNGYSLPPWPRDKKGSN